MPSSFLALIIAIIFSVSTTIAFTGDLTYYAPSMGSCGATSSPSDDVVALSAPVMANGANPNANGKCFSTIHVKNPRTGVVWDATVVDTCLACKAEDIDVSPALFGKVAPGGDGRVGGIEWWW